MKKLRMVGCEVSDNEKGGVMIVDGSDLEVIVEDTKFLRNGGPGLAVRDGAKKREGLKELGEGLTRAVTEGVTRGLT